MFLPAGVEMDGFDFEEIDLTPPDGDEAGGVGGVRDDEYRQPMAPPLGPQPLQAPLFSPTRLTIHNKSTCPIDVFWQPPPADPDGFTP